MAALTPSDEPYLTTSIFKLAKNRITWLMVLMISSTFTSMLIAGYEESLSVLLMMFVPRLMNTGGNAGSQASTLIIRGMAVGEIEFRDILKVWLREIGIAALCGLALGIVNFAQIYFMNGRDMNLSLTVSFALFFIIVIAKSVGCILPMVAKKLRIDPAIMASPMITTILDAASLLIYFSIARMLMGL
jgi:magnesium transporter